MNKHNTNRSPFELFILALIFLMISNKGWTQAEISIQSPTAASLVKHLEIPVSYFTGVPNISIPLFDIDEGDLQMPITLNYHSSGFNPNEHPGWVGMNWTLNVGGVITRKVNSWPDDYFFYSRNQKVAYRGYYYREGYHAQLDKYKPYHGYTEYLNYPFTSSTDRLLDGQPDEFYFNFGRYSGKFYFNEDMIPFVAANHDGLKIEVHKDLHQEVYTLLI